MLITTQSQELKQYQKTYGQKCIKTFIHRKKKIGCLMAKVMLIYPYKSIKISSPPMSRESIGCVLQTPQVKVSYRKTAVTSDANLK